LWLGYSRFIGFVMASPSVAYKINNNIALEGISKINRQLSDKNHRFGIIGIDMENGSLDHLGDIGAVLGRAGINALAGGKPT